MISYFRLAFGITVLAIVAAISFRNAILKPVTAPVSQGLLVEGNVIYPQGGYFLNSDNAAMLEVRDNKDCFDSAKRGRFVFCGTIDKGR